MTLSDPILVPRSAIDALTSRCGEAKFASLWVAGSLEGLVAPTVAVVGTRAATSIGLRRAKELAEGLGRAGVSVISGLALGIDAAAHRGALAAGAPTIGVLGSGHDTMYPSANRALAEEMIARGGAVVSPYAPGTPAFPHRFLARNAVVAALADVVVVVEAAARSGAINTAGWAAELNRPVLAFPGEVERAKAAGCLALIRDGATLARGVEDVLAALPTPQLACHTERARSSPMAGRTPLERSVLDALREEPRTVDDLVETVRLDAHSVVATLTTLEIEGAVVRGSGATYSPAT